MKSDRIFRILSMEALIALALIACDSRTSAPTQGSGGSPPAPAQPAADPPPAAAQPEIKGEASLTRNFYFVFDGSGSMSQACGGDHVTKIVGAKQALVRFLSIVPANCNLGLYVFDASGVREVVPLGPSNRDAFLGAVKGIHPANGTPLGEAIEFGVVRLAEQRDRQLGYGDFRLVVVTDGEANGQVPLSKATAYAQSKGIPIYTIGLCIGHDHELRKSSVSYRAANSIADLQKGLEQTLGETDVFDASSFEDSHAKP